MLEGRVYKDIPIKAPANEAMVEIKVKPLSHVPKNLLRRKSNICRLLLNDGSEQGDWRCRKKSTQLMRDAQFCRRYYRVYVPNKRGEGYAQTATRAEDEEGRLRQTSSVPWLQI